MYFLNFVILSVMYDIFIVDIAYFQYITLLGMKNSDDMFLDGFKIWLKYIFSSYYNQSWVHLPVDSHLYII